MVESIITIIPIYGFNFLHLQGIIPRIESIISRAESMGEFTTCPESDNGRIGKILITHLPIIIDLHKDLKWKDIKDEILSKFGSIWSLGENRISFIKLYFTQL